MSELQPVGLAIVLCEDAHRREDGKLNLIGVVNRLECPEFPHMLPKLCVYFALTDIRPGCVCSIDIVYADSEEALLPAITLQLPQIEAAMGTGVFEMTLDLAPFPVPRPGTYIARVLAHQTIVLQRTLLVESTGQSAALCERGNSTTDEATGDSREMSTELALDSSKETPNKLRWAATVEDKAVFEIYIPKWRVPEPWPARISVTVVPRIADRPDPPPLTKAEAAQDPSQRLCPVIESVEPWKECGNVIRCRPIPQARGKAVITDPCIPKSMTYDSASELTITVEWDLPTRGKFSGTGP